MLEQYSPSMIKKWANQFLNDLKNSSFPMPDNWLFRSIDHAHVDTSIGFILIKWKKPQVNDRLKASFSYVDEDGISPFISMVFDSKNCLQEMEIWRGDNKNLVNLPMARDVISI